MPPIAMPLSTPNAIPMILGIIGQKKAHTKAAIANTVQMISKIVVNLFIMFLIKSNHYVLQIPNL